MVQSSQQLYQQLVKHERAPARKRHTLSACAPKTSAAAMVHEHSSVPRPPASSCTTQLPGAVGIAVAGDRDADIEPSAEDEEADETVGEETGRLESEYALSRLGPAG